MSHGTYRELTQRRSNRHLHQSNWYKFSKVSASFIQLCLSSILSSEHTFENFYRRHPYRKSTPHTSVCIAVYIYTHIHIYIHTHVYMYTHIHIYIHTHTYIHIHTCLYIHTYMYIYIDIHIYICIYTHTHVYTHAHTHSTYLSLHCCTDKTKQNIVVCHHVMCVNKTKHCRLSSCHVRETHHGASEASGGVCRCVCHTHMCGVRVSRIHIRKCRYIVHT